MARRFEGLVVRAVLFRRLRHQAHVRDRSHRSRIEGAVRFAKLDDLAIDRRIAGVGNHALDVLELAVRIPHLAAVADDRRHGGVDDHVARDVEVGDTLVGIHHRHRRPLPVDGLDVRLNGLPLLVGQGLDLGVDVAEPVIRIHTELLEGLPVLFEHVLVIDGHGMAENLRIRDLHHGGLHVEREENALLLGVLDLFLDELTQGRDAHEGRIEDFPGL